ncbi:hypothetical protein E2C01_083096 [Portunus trituberculatus]|uniref:Uncharacterized protein n=1 Tax=Portunus trituberculatus TaxID=210409 RepID=A0A5B7J0U7_PORTR|nr:hypothetical protein [Portunus trituberculatus]
MEDQKKTLQWDHAKVQWQSLPNWIEKSHTSSVTGGMTSTCVEGEEGMRPMAEQEQTGHVNAPGP